MRYFYVNSDKQAVGPLDRDALQQLHVQGAITDETMVALEGETVWRSYAETMATPGSGPAFETPPMLPRPAAVTAFGICNVILGVLGVICIPFSTIMVIVGAFGGAAMGQSSMVSGAAIFSSILTFFQRAALLTSGIGLLRSREWGRKVALVCAIVEVFLAIVSIALIFYNPALEDMPQQGRLVAVLLPFPFIFVRVFYAVIMFVFLRGPNVRDALKV